MLGLFTSLVSGFLDHLMGDIRDSIRDLVERYLLGTHDLSLLTPQPLTANAAIQQMYHLTLAMADLLLVLIVVWAMLRSQWERGFRAHYTLKAILPRMLAALALAHFGLAFGQMVIDLNNALVHAVWTAGSAPAFPWTFALTQPFGMGLFELGIRLAIVVMLLIIALTYVLRFALLAILLVLAPLAALCLILPETKNYARAWNHVFLITVFMQFVQVLILRLASVFLIDPRSSLVQALYGLAVLYLLIKVPGLMSASAHLELKAEHLVHNLAKHALKGAGAPVRAAPAS